MVLASAGASVAQAANINCATCALQMRVNSQQQPLSPAVGDQNSANVNLGINVAGLLTRPAALQFTQPALPAGTNKETQFWNGQGELPNAFVRPWDFPKTNFDPSFITDYYTTQQGPINSANAPWNIFLPPSIAQDYFNTAMAGLGPVSPMIQNSSIVWAPTTVQPAPAAAPAPATPAGVAITAPRLRI